jgi:hypothetical protein
MYVLILLALLLSVSASAQCYGYNCSPRGYNYPRYAPQYTPQRRVDRPQPFWYPRPQAPYSYRRDWESFSSYRRYWPNR